MNPTELIPHRPPFLLVDEITDLDPGKSGRGLFAVPKDLPILAGHFPGRPILPGVYLVEAIAQLGAAVVLSDPRFAGTLPLFGGIDKARFRRQVLPGDTVELEISLVSLGTRSGKGAGSALVEGNRAAEVEIFFVIAPGNQEGSNSA
jgi:3-hydroxyacyl-[acyl-carrier-protein] dehydratase